MKKLCTKCNELKSFDAFYNHSGRSDGKADWCKTCAKTYKSSPKALARQRERRNTPEGQAKQRAYRQTEAYKESQRRYRQSKKGKKSHKRHSAKYKEKYPEKRKAKDYLNNLIRDGGFPHVSTKKCQRCGNQAEHYHHESYLPEHWLKVIPYCSDCHKHIHASRDS